MLNYNIGIKCDTIDLATIEKINKLKGDDPEYKVLLEIPNTKGISSDMLRRLSDGIYLRISGAYNDQLISRMGNNYYENGETGKYYTYSVIYTKSEVIKIVSEMEKIESGIDNKHATDLEKTVYIYDKLKSSIMYDPQYKVKGSSEIRSLRGLISKKTVCAGYAVILKELLDRQNVECHYVQGNGHAWNIVTIDGKNYPIDLTWDNNRYRSGKFDTYAFFARDAETFAKEHIPDKNDPCSDFKLSEIPNDIVHKAGNKMSGGLNEYYQTIFKGDRQDGSQFVIAQVGNKVVNGKMYYKYYYSDLDQNKKGINSSILYSGTNVIDYINKTMFEEETFSKQYNGLLNNVLFSKSNIADSLKNGTGYIGEIILSENDLESNTISVVKTDKEQKLFESSTKTYKRTDGSEFVVEKNSAEKVKKNKMFQYCIYENISENENYVVKTNKVVSEKDFLLDNRQAIADDYLSRSRLDRKARESSGYIGYYSNDGRTTYDKEIKEFYKQRFNTEQEFRKFKEDEERWNKILRKMSWAEKIGNYIINIIEKMEYKLKQIRPEKTQKQLLDKAYDGSEKQISYFEKELDIQINEGIKSETAKEYDNVNDIENTFLQNLKSSLNDNVQYGENKKQEKDMDELSR